MGEFILNNTKWKRMYNLGSEKGNLFSYYTECLQQCRKDMMSSRDVSDVSIRIPVATAYLLHMHSYPHCHKNQYPHPHHMDRGVCGFLSKSTNWNAWKRSNAWLIFWRFAVRYMMPSHSISWEFSQNYCFAIYR